jgi:hypothetical protein
MPNPQAFSAYLDSVRRATNETQTREHFIILAAAGFDDTEFARNLALGAEYQVRFQSRGLLRRGAIDSLYGNLIIEFEQDLGRTREHARHQLRAYVAGAWTEEGRMDRPYLAVATDGLRWEVFAAVPREASQPISQENVELQEVESWEPSGGDDAEELRIFLNRLFFRKNLLAPTAANFAKDFGLASAAYVKARSVLHKKLDELADSRRLKVLRAAWHASLQVAYGSIETDDDLFVKHTYLATLARLLVWSAFERRPPSREQLQEVLSGIYFKNKGIENLVEDDFFQWISITSKTEMFTVWSALAKQLVGYDLAKIKEDILKRLYEELVDPLTRHELGEFYTPDWLAELLVRRLLHKHDWKLKGVPRLLDPACGSGTFLRAAINLARRRSGRANGELLLQLLSRVMGIDVHPLAVIISRATYTLALADLIEFADRGITVPVFLANALMMPQVQRQMTITGSTISLEIDGLPYEVPEELVLHGTDYDAAIDDVLAVAKSFAGSGSRTSPAASFKAKVKDRLDAYGGAATAEVLGRMTEHLVRLIREDSNSVHGFLLKNHYRPSMLRHQFEYVAGNPPWLTLADIGTPSYRDLVLKLAVKTGIASRAIGAQSHTELATVFLAAVVDNYVQVRGDAVDPRIGMVMTRSVFTAAHHRALRQGLYEPRFDVMELWDLKDLGESVFRIPSCVVFISMSAPRPQRPKRGIVFSGHLSVRDVPWSEAHKTIELRRTRFELAFLGQRSAWRPAGDSRAPAASSRKVNAYRERFRQGAILYPQRLLVVAPKGARNPRRATTWIVTDQRAAKSAKKGMDFTVNHLVEQDHLFNTAAADHILPYALNPNLWMVVLPTVGRPGEKGFRTASAEELRRLGAVHTADWLDWAEKAWTSLRKQGETTPLFERLDYLKQLSSQAEMRRHLVLYAAVGARPVSCAVDLDQLDLPFVARDQTFWCACKSEHEAHYLAAFLNSAYVAGAILDWMTRGHHGPRHIYKRVVDVAWPEFRPEDPDHDRLATLGKELSQEAEAAVLDLRQQASSWLRRAVRSRLNVAKLQEVEELVRRVCLSVGQAAPREVRRG